MYLIVNPKRILPRKYHISVYNHHSYYTRMDLIDVFLSSIGTDHDIEQLFYIYITYTKEKITFPG
jgi:hypothetical protein